MFDAVDTPAMSILPSLLKSPVVSTFRADGVTTSDRWKVVASTWRKSDRTRVVVLDTAMSGRQQPTNSPMATPCGRGPVGIAATRAVN